MPRSLSVKDGTTFLSINIKQVISLTRLRFYLQDNQNRAGFPVDVTPAFKITVYDLGNLVETEFDTYGIRLCVRVIQVQIVYII